MNKELRAEKHPRRLHLRPYSPRPKQIWSWQTIGSVFGFTGGFITIILGSVLTAIGWFTKPSILSSSLQRYGTILFTLTIPLLALGSHCLDLSDKKADPSTSVPVHPEEN